MPDYIPPTLWSPNSPDLNPVDCSVWSVLQEKVYRSRIADVDELKSRLIDEWAQFDQSIVDVAISQWRRRLSSCVRVRGHTSSLNSDNFESNCYTKLYFCYINHILIYCSLIKSLERLLQITTFSVM